MNNQIEQLIDNNDFESFKELFNNKIVYLGYNEYCESINITTRNIEFFKYASNKREPFWEVCALNAFYNRYCETFQYIIQYCGKYDPYKLINDTIDIYDVELGNKNELIYSHVNMNGQFYRRLRIIMDRNNKYLPEPYSGIRVVKRGLSLFKVNFNKFKMMTQNGHINILINYLELMNINTSFIPWVVYICFKREIEKPNSMTWGWWFAGLFGFKEESNIPDKLIGLSRLMKNEETSLFFLIYLIATNKLPRLYDGDPLFDLNCFIWEMPQYIFGIKN